MPDLRNTARRHAVRLFLFCAFCALWALTALTPLLADDFIYAFSYANGFRLDTLESVLLSLSAHRHNINARVLSHFFAMFFLTKPKWVFNLCNALVLTGGLALQAGFLRVWGRERLLPCAAGLLWLCMPVFGQVYLWLDGSCNYAWGLTLALLALLPFYRAYALGEGDWPLWKKLGFLPLCVAAGAYSEHISFSLLAAAFLLLLARALEEKRLRFYPALAFLCCAGGYAALMLGPTVRGALGILQTNGTLGGKLRRLALLLCAALALAALGFWLLQWLLRRGKLRALCRVLRLCTALGWVGAVALLAYRALRSEATLPAALAAVLSSSALGLLSALALLAWALLSALLRGAERKRILSAALLGFGGLCCFAMAPLTFYFPARASAATVQFSILAALSLLELPEKRAPRRALGFAATLLLLLSLGLGLRDIVGLHTQAVERERTIREELADGADTVALRAYGCTTKYAALYGLDDLDPPGSEWPRDAIGMYYGIAHVISLPNKG